MNTFFLMFVISLGIFGIIGMFIAFDPYNEGKVFNRKLKFITVASVVISTFLMPFALQSWELEANKYRQALNQEGIAYVEGYIPFNAPVIHKVIIIHDGADLDYYQIIGVNK